MAAVWFFYLLTYYHSENVETYLASSDKVEVKEIKNRRFFDGPGEEEAMIFYPGAKVATDSYAPLMYQMT